MSAAELLAEALEAGFVIAHSPRGDRLQILSVTDELLPPCLRERLVAAKAELLRYLERREQAIAIVVESFRRLEEVYPIGCSVAGPNWSTTERAVDEAYVEACEAGDLDGLHIAVERYEQFALACFASSRSREGGSRP